MLWRIRPDCACCVLSPSFQTNIRETGRRNRDECATTDYEKIVLIHHCFFDVRDVGLRISSDHD